MDDLRSNILVVQSIVPQTVVLTLAGEGGDPPAETSRVINGSYVSIYPYEMMVWVVGIGALGGATVSIKLQESDDHTNWSDIEANRLIGAFVPGVANSVQKVGLTELGKLPGNFIRPVVTVTGGTGTGLSVHVIQSEGTISPVGTSGSVYIA